VSFFRNPQTGQVVLAQAPNPPLLLFLAASALRLALSGDARTAASVVAGGALVWWSVDEIVRGDSPFRRVLGAVVLAGWAASRLR
jgi:hypothetical protein